MLGLVSYMVCMTVRVYGSKVFAKKVNFYDNNFFYVDQVHTQNLNLHYKYAYKVEYKLKLIARYSVIRNHVSYFYDKSRSTFIVKVYFYDKV